jgi:hypothetical protein
MVLGLTQSVRAISGVATPVAASRATRFRYLSKEWGAVYQRLVGLFAERLVIIGRSSPQFLFVPPK